MVELPVDYGAPRGTLLGGSLCYWEGMNLILKIKSKIFLKDKQKEVLNNLVVKQWNTLAILPTGFGKSLLYQVPVAAGVFTGRRTTHCNNGEAIEKKFYVHGSEGYTLR